MSIGGPIGWGRGSLDANQRLRDMETEAGVREHPEIPVPDLRWRPRRALTWVLLAGAILAAIVVAAFLFR